VLDILPGNTVFKSDTSPVEKGGGGGVTTSKKKPGFGWLRLIAPCKGPCLGLRLVVTRLV
jgi:hypothetical protein